MEELRRLRRTVVDVTYRGVAPALDDAAGVTDTQQLDRNRLRFNVAGPPAAALRALAAAEVVAVSMREPTLEEIFLDYYGGAAR